MKNESEKSSDSIIAEDPNNIPEKQEKSSNTLNLRVVVSILLLISIFACTTLRYFQYLTIQEFRKRAPKISQTLKPQAFFKNFQETVQTQNNSLSLSESKNVQLQNSKKQNYTKQGSLLKKNIAASKFSQDQIAKNSSRTPFSQSLNQNIDPFLEEDQKAIFKLPILPDLQIPESDRKVTAVFTTCCYRYDLLGQTLFSFFARNTFLSGLNQIIVVNDGPQTPQIASLKQSYPNITWIFTPETVGQIQAIDIAYNQVKTPFVFHAEDDWLFLKPKFIEIGFQYFQRIPKLLQTWIKITNQTVDPQTRIVDSPAFGFSFNPGLKRMQHYNMLKNGYKWISKDISHKKGAGKAQGLIIRYYKKKGFVVAQTQLNYVQHIGDQRSLPKANF